MFQHLAFPNVSRPGEDAENRREYFAPSIYAKIEQARRARMQRLKTRATLPLKKSQLDELIMSRVGDNNLNRLVSLLPERVSSGLEGQAEVATAAFASGVAVSANIHMGGFDTHSNHDQNHSRRLAELLEGLDHLWTQIELKNLQDKVTVVVGSDFGRTPFYNDNRGKDHWNVTSIMAMGAGVRGNRIIGATDDHVEALKIKSQTLQVNPNGIMLTPDHIHLALSRMAGVSAQLSSQFGLSGSELNLFS